MHLPSSSQFQKTVNRMAWSSGCQNRQPDDQAIRFTVFWNCEPDGGCIRFSFSKNVNRMAWSSSWKGDGFY